MLLNINGCTCIWYELNNIYEYTWYELSKCVAVRLVRGFANCCNDTCLIFIKGWLLFSNACDFHFGNKLSIICFNCQIYC